MTQSFELKTLENKLFPPALEFLYLSKSRASQKNSSVLNPLPRINERNICNREEHIFILDLFLLPLEYFYNIFLLKTQIEYKGILLIIIILLFY